MSFKNKKNIKLLSLFDGIGCFPLALANLLNIKPEDFSYTSSEIEPYLIDIINKNFPKVKQLGDIEKVDYNSLNADIITMGTPCTGFSVSGNCLAIIPFSALLPITDLISVATFGTGSPVILQSI